MRVYSVEDLEEPRTYKPPKKNNYLFDDKKAKLKGKQLLPPHIEKKSEKWYYDTQEKRWIIADKIKAQYRFP